MHSHLIRITLLSPILFVLVGASLASCGDDGGGDELRLGDTDNGKTFEVAEGGKVIITLESNPSTGFAWKVEIPAEPQLVLKGEPVYVAPTPTPEMVGAPGKQVFTFEAKTKGTAVLQLAYVRSSGAPDRLYEVTITVK